MFKKIVFMWAILGLYACATGSAIKELPRFIAHNATKIGSFMSAGASTAATFLRTRTAQGVQVAKQATSMAAPLLRSLPYIGKKICTGLVGLAGRHPIVTTLLLGGSAVIGLGAVAAKRSVAFRTQLEQTRQKIHILWLRLGLALGANVNGGGIYAPSPLYLAASRGDLAMVQFYLSHGADIHKGLWIGDTPLHVAVFYRHMPIVQYLLAHHADINRRGRNGQTPLHDACLIGHNDIAQYLIDHRANIALADGNGLRPIHVAAREGHTNVVATLVNNFEDIDITTGGAAGKNALRFAAENNRLDTARWLVIHGARIDDQLARTVKGADAMMLSPEIRSFLSRVTPDADRSYRIAPYSNRLLLTAISENNVEAARDSVGVAQLVRRNPDATPLMGAIDIYDPQNPTPKDIIARILINAGTPVTVVDSHGNTPLHLAALHKNTRLARLFLKNGARVDAQNNNHENPFDIALRNHSLDMVKLLFAHGKQLITPELFQNNMWLVARGAGSEPRIAIQ